MDQYERDGCQDHVLDTVCEVAEQHRKGRGVCEESLPCHVWIRFQYSDHLTTLRSRKRYRVPYTGICGLGFKGFSDCLSDTAHTLRVPGNS